MVFSGYKAPKDKYEQLVKIFFEIKCRYINVWLLLLKYLKRDNFEHHKNDKILLKAWNVSLKWIYKKILFLNFLASIFHSKWTFFYFLARNNPIINFGSKWPHCRSKGHRDFVFESKLPHSRWLALIDYSVNFRLEMNPGLIFDSKCH